MVHPFANGRLVYSRPPFDADNNAKNMDPSANCAECTVASEKITKLSSKCSYGMPKILRLAGVLE